jgi:hypothetical protein
MQTTQSVHSVEAVAASTPGASVDARATRSKLLIAAGCGMLGLPFLFEAIGILRANTEWLINRLADDAFYYLEVARRMSHGDGSTFDGIHATNGYHPLWQWMLVPLSWLFPGNDAFVKATLLLGLALTFVALLLVVRIVWRLAGPGPALVGGMLAIHGTGGWGGLATSVNGLESAATLAALAVLLTALVWWAESPSTKRGVVVGICCAVAVLARLDLMAVLWLVPVAMAVRLRSWRPVAHVLLGGLFVGGPYAVWFLARYHHVLTTSATIKEQEISSVFDERFGGRFTGAAFRYLLTVSGSYLRVLLDPTGESPAPDGSSLATLISVTGKILAGAGTVICYLRWVHSRDRTSTNTRSRPLSTEGFALSVIGSVVVVKAVFDVVNAPLWAEDWYSAPQHFALSFALGAFAWVTVLWLWERSRVFGAIAATAVIAVCLPSNVGLVTDTHHAPRIAGGWQDEIHLASGWILRHGPPGRYGAADAGLLGFDLDRSRDVVNLDGLVNNYEFAALHSRGTNPVDLARAEGVRYYVGRVTDQNRAGPFACARVLWTSPNPIVYGDSLNPVTQAPVYVFDLRGCG